MVSAVTNSDSSFHPLSLSLTYINLQPYQYGDRVFTHDAVIHSGTNEATLRYPSGLIDTGEFHICVTSNNYDDSACDTRYNSEAKQPEHVFINLYVEENRNLPDGNVDSQMQSQSQDNEQSQSQNNNQEQTTTIHKLSS